MAGSASSLGMAAFGRNQPDRPVVAAIPLMRANAELATASRPNRLSPPREQPSAAIRPATAVARRVASPAAQGSAPVGAAASQTAQPSVAASAMSPALAITRPGSSAASAMPQVTKSTPTVAVVQRLPERQATAGVLSSFPSEMMQPSLEGASEPASSVEVSCTCSDSSVACLGTGSRARRSRQRHSACSRCPPDTYRIQACAHGPGCIARIAGCNGGAPCHCTGRFACRTGQQHSGRSHGASSSFDSRATAGGRSGVAATAGCAGHAVCFAGRDSSNGKPAGRVALKRRNGRGDDPARLAWSYLDLG